MKTDYVRRTDKMERARHDQGKENEKEEIRTGEGREQI